MSPSVRFLTYDCCLRLRHTLIHSYFFSFFIAAAAKTSSSFAVHALPFVMLG